MPAMKSLRTWLLSLTWLYASPILMGVTGISDRFYSSPSIFTYLSFHLTSTPPCELIIIISPIEK